MKCEYCGKELVEKADRVSAWWMWDNHTFTRLDGTIEEKIAMVIKCEEKDNWGMLGSVIVLSGEKELRRVGPYVSGRCAEDQSVFLKGVEKWKTEILKDDDVQRLLPES